MSLKKNNTNNMNNNNSCRILCPFFRNGLCRDFNACQYNHVYCRHNHACNREDCIFGHSLDYKCRLKVIKIVEEFGEYRQKIFDAEISLTNAIDEMINKKDRHDSDDENDDELSKKDTESKTETTDEIVEAV